MATSSTRLPKRIQSALEESGLQWSLEVGSRHIKLKLEGHLVGIFPKGGTAANGDTDPRKNANVVAQIRRAAARLKTSGGKPVNLRAPV